MSVMPNPSSLSSENQAGIEKLAPAAKRQYVVGRPNIMDTDLFLARVQEILSQRSFTNNGRFVVALEELACRLLNVPHCIAVSNATIALEIVLRALELKGEVIVPSFSFVASAHAIAMEGLTPVFCDVNPTTCCIDAKTIEPLINENTSAIMAVNVYGGLCNIAELENLAKRRNLKLIFDSAHSLGCRLDGKYDGSFGDVEVFSLHATKFINGFEGGLITTTNEALAKRLRLMRNFGFSGYDKVDCLGTNAKLSEIHAAMALTNLEHMPEIIAINFENHSNYKKHLPPQVTLLEFGQEIESNYQYVVTFVPADKRDALVNFLHESGIMARKYFYPGIHKFPPYSDKNFDLPITDDLAARVICLPTGQDVDKKAVEWICETIKAFFS
jgi:dTDP-4-amino-4,6-dideoxygalactose transaminase